MPEGYHRLDMKPQIRPAVTEMYRLSAPGWVSPQVVFVTGALARLRGVHSLPGGVGAIFRTRSVHGFGLDYELSVLSIDSSGVIVRNERLRRSRVIVCRKATWMIELPIESRVPVRGTMLQLERCF